MNSRKTVIGVVLGVASLVLAFFAVPANAQDYPPTGETVALDDLTVEQGGVLSGSVSGFEPGTATGQYNPTFTFPIAPDGTGSFSHTISCSVAVGEHTLILTSGSSTASAGFVVTPGSSCPAAAPGEAAGGADLPRTGNDEAVSMAQMAILAIASGGLMVMIARRRMVAS